MIKHLAIMALVAMTASAAAQNVEIQRNEYGSGTPGQRGMQNADNVENDIFHSPQYLPFHPTAGTIWPRVVEVPCIRTAAGLKCEGYNWTPKMGRGEYLFFKPRIIEPAKQEIIVREVLKEVPSKKIRQ